MTMGNGCTVAAENRVNDAAKERKHVRKEAEGVEEAATHGPLTRTLPARALPLPVEQTRQHAGSSSAHYARAPRRWRRAGAGRRKQGERKKERKVSSSRLCSFRSPFLSLSFSDPLLLSAAADGSPLRRPICGRASEINSACDPVS